MLQNIFTGGRKEQVLLAGVAGFGVVLAIFALLFLSGGDGDDSTPADDDQATPTATLDDAGTPAATSTRAATATREPTGTATGSPTVDPSATVTEDPDGTQTPSGDSNQGSDGSGSNPATATRPPAATATPVPTATPAASSLAYCDTGGTGDAPPSSIFGLLTVGGVVAPSNTTVALAFDGAVGPAGKVTVDGDTAGYRVDYYSGGVDCANQAGAAIFVVVNGQFFATGATVGPAAIALLFNVDAN